MIDLCIGFLAGVFVVEFGRVIYSYLRPTQPIEWRLYFVNSSLPFPQGYEIVEEFVDPFGGDVYLLRGKASE